MPSLRITAVAALATAALVVPATASAKDEAATAAAVGTQPAAPLAAVDTKDEAATAAAVGNQPASPAVPALVAAATSGSPPPVIGPRPNNPLAAVNTKDEAATAAAISTQPSAPASSQPAPPPAPACGLAAGQQAALTSNEQQIKDAQSRGDIATVQHLLAERNQMLDALIKQQRLCHDAQANMAANIGP